MTAICPYIVTSDEGTSYCRLAEANSQPTPNDRQIRSSDHFGEVNKMVITPPPELVQQWMEEFNDPQHCHWEEYETGIATRAAQWGADQELEACCEWLHGVGDLTLQLRAARRPKPSSLKKEALDILRYPKNLWSQGEVDTIRRALEQLDD